MENVIVMLTFSILDLFLQVLSNDQFGILMLPN